jgi:hypothetical protein
LGHPLAVNLQDSGAPLTFVACGLSGVRLAISDDHEGLKHAIARVLRRDETDGTVTFVAASGTAVHRFPVGSRWILGGHNLSTIVAQTRRPARIDSFADSSSRPLGVHARERASAQHPGS